MSESLRRKSCHTDKEVQGTNDDAQISKLSCVRAGYFEDAFVQYFVRTPSRRSPLINRGRTALLLGYGCGLCVLLGYFSRSYALRRLVDTFLDRFPEQCDGRACQIVSLGAGFDSTWFCLKKEKKQPLKYIELDFQEVTSQKVSIIQGTKALEALIEESRESQEENVRLGTLVTSDYCTLPVDLRDLRAVADALNVAGFDQKLPTLILAECVLVYLDPDESTRLIEYFGRTLSNAIFLVYEQIRPDDAFGRQMMKNLEERGCPLRGLKSTPSLAAHEQRFKQNGWKKATAWDMDTVYKSIIPREEHLRISKLEIFDEFEEWHMIQEHYSICIGTNDSRGIFKGYGFKALKTQTQ